MLWWLISPSCSLSLAHKGPHKTKHSASFIGITVGLYYSSRQLTHIWTGRKNWTSAYFTSFFSHIKGVKKWRSLYDHTCYVDKSVFIVLVEWPSKLQYPVSNMTVLKMYIWNVFDPVTFWKHFWLSRSLLATANKGRAHFKFPAVRPVQRCLWSWLGK